MSVSQRIRVYDFRKPDKFSKDHLRGLEMVFGYYGRLVGSNLVGALRTTVQMSVVDVAQVSFGEFFDRLRAPLIVAVGSLPPLPGRFCVVMEQGLVFAMIGHLLGGGEAGVYVENRPLTEIEQRIVERLLTGTLAALRDALAQAVSVEPHLETIEANPLFVQVVSPGEMTAVVSLEVTVAGRAGLMRFCLPYSTLEPALPHLLPYPVEGGGHRAAAGTGWDLAEVPVEVTVCLGRARLTVRDLLGLEVGDVVTLDTRTVQPLTCLVEGVPKFLGRVGRRGRSLAFVVEALLEAAEGTEEGDGSER